MSIERPNFGSGESKRDKILDAVASSRAFEYSAVALSALYLVVATIPAVIEAASQVDRVLNRPSSLHPLVRFLANIAGQRLG